MLALGKHKTSHARSEAKRGEFPRSATGFGSPQVQHTSTPRMTAATPRRRDRRGA